MRANTFHRIFEIKVYDVFLFVYLFSLLQLLVCSITNLLQLPPSDNVILTNAILVCLIYGGNYVFDAACFPLSVSRNMF